MNTRCSFSHVQEGLGMRLHFLIHLSVILCRLCQIAGVEYGLTQWMVHVASYCKPKNSLTLEVFNAKGVFLFRLFML